jgi:hypothetical protein
MNKFIGQKIIIKKWQSAKTVLQTQKPWVIFEKEYMLRSTEELEKIRNVKEDLKLLMKNFMPDYEQMLNTL